MKGNEIATFEDEKIIKALEHCKVSNCLECPCHSCIDNCLDVLTPNALDLIKRQKAEIERLNTMHSEMCIGMKVLKKTAIKEYKEKVKDVLMEKSIFPILVKNALDEAEKELVGE